jgi:uncharacterized membrane protein
MADWIRLALHPHFHLAWNLFLALVPLALAMWLFREKQRPGWLWWPVLVVFVVFLPNAAYTLTDIIHFIDEVRDKDPLLPEWSVVYVVVPKYAVFWFIGIQSHTISLLLLVRYLRWRGRSSWVVWDELALNFLCAIGVFWGRYFRLNSWDIVTNPQKVAEKVLGNLTSHLSLQHIAWYFITITLAYYIFKLVDLAVWEFWVRRAHD